jgi:Cu/Ag efflux protein CusF
MKKTILLVAFITLVAFVSGVMAQGKPATAPAPAAPASTKPAPPAQLEKFSGKIKSVDAMAKSIVVAKKEIEKSFVIDESTKITKGNETVTLADLKAGTKVLIEAKKEGDKLIASTIKVSAPKAAPVKK